LLGRNGECPGRKNLQILVHPERGMLFGTFWKKLEMEGIDPGAVSEGSIRNGDMS